MDDMLKESLEGFDDLWRRVSCMDQAPGAPGERTGALEDALLRLIHEEVCAVTYAAALARMFQGESRSVLQRHAAGAKRHLRRLRAEYFLAAGVAAGHNEDCRALTGKLPGLRTAFLQAREMAAGYERAAERTDSPELREAFGVFAADERRRARELRSLVIESF